MIIDLLMVADQVAVKAGVGGIAVSFCEVNGLFPLPGSGRHGRFPNLEKSLILLDINCPSRSGFSLFNITCTSNFSCYNLFQL
jgi:hypothetical protein